MDLYSVSISRFKNLFFQSAFLMVMAIVACYILINNGYIILSNFDPGRKYTLPILFGMVLLSVFYSYYRKNSLERIFRYAGFDEQVMAYEKVYKSTLGWYLFSCLISCFLSVLTARNAFLYYALFDLLVTLPYYPNKIIFRKELRNDEIILVK